jgi:NADPH:quinone reductase-like Zn-dependent oxidoreductase
MRKRLEIVGTLLRSRPLEEKSELVETFADRALEWIAAGRVTPVVHGVIDLERAADAHALMERNENFGKIVLAVGSDGDA